MNSEDDAPPGTPSPNLAEDERRTYRKQKKEILLAEANRLMQQRVNHPGGGTRTVAETLADQEAQRQQISYETAHGSLRHRHVPQWLRWIPEFVLLLDFILLTYYFAGLTNVDWRSPLASNLLGAGALALMVTVISYGFLAFTGFQVRSHKNCQGTVHPGELDAVTRVTLSIAAVLIIVLAVVMYLHVNGEVTDAHGSRAVVTTLVLPLTVAVVSTVGNIFVVLIHALDGSDETDRLRKLAAATRRPVHKVERLRRRAAQMDL